MTDGELIAKSERTQMRPIFFQAAELLTIVPRSTLHNPPRLWRTWVECARQRAPAAGSCDAGPVEDATILFEASAAGTTSGEL